MDVWMFFEEWEIQVSYLLYARYARPIMLFTRLTCGLDALDSGITNLMVVEARSHDSIFTQVIDGKGPDKKVTNSTDMAQISTVGSLT